MSVKKVLLALMMCGSVAGAADLFSLLESADFWQLPAAELQKKHMVGVPFSRVDDATIRVPRSSDWELEGLEHGEMVMKWGEKGGPETITVMIYNKGDDGELDKDEFQAKLDTCGRILDAKTGGKSKLRRMDKKDSGVKGKARLWQAPEYVALLESASTGKGKAFTSEFIRLTLAADEAALEKGGAADAANRAELKANVRKEEDGTVWIDGIPMVDQGEKGYCVPATVSRVFAYYGVDGVDQHALAALCDSDGDDGTSLRSMRNALESISRKFHFRLKTLEDADMRSLMAAYNKAAKKAGQPAVTVETLSFFKFDPEVMRKARVGNGNGVRKWMSSVKKSIDAGIPLLWSVRLGIMPEPSGSQSSGGHMRLIIGYNMENETIVFSDSWGAKHARKEMPAEDAYCISIERNILRPSR